MMAKIVTLITNLAVAALLGWLAWYGYSHWVAASSGADDSAQGTWFNCRQAKASLARGYECRDSSSCTLTGEEKSDLKTLEAGIEENCN